MKKTIYLAFCVLMILSTFSSENKTILFLGDSLTDGHGLDRSQVYSSLIEQKFKQAKTDCKVINGGVDGSTTAGGLRRLKWYLKRAKLDVLVVQLGANDGMRGFPVSEIRKNLNAIIDYSRGKNPKLKIYLAAMNIFPSMGEKYVEEFKTVFEVVAKEKKVVLIPFFLAGVAGVEGMNQADGIHPNAKGHAQVAENIWKVIAQ